MGAGFVRRRTRSDGEPARFKAGREIVGARRASAKLRRGRGRRRADRRDLVPGRTRAGVGAARQISADPRRNCRSRSIRTAKRRGRPGHRRGKDEAWLVLEAEPGARIGLGLKREVSAGRAARRDRGGHARGAGRLARGEGGRFLLFTGGHDPRPRAGADPRRDPGECRSHLPSVRLRPRARAPGRGGGEGGAAGALSVARPGAGDRAGPGDTGAKAGRSSSSAGPGPRAAGWPARWSGRSGWCRCAAAG